MRVANCSRSWLPNVCQCTERSKLAHLSHREQRRVLSRKAQRVNDQEAAAAAINRFLAQHVKESAIDLGKLCDVIVKGLRTS